MCLNVQILGLVVYLKQGDVLKLHVTTKYLLWRKGRKIVDWFSNVRITTLEKSHAVNPWRVVFPEVVSLVLISTCWPNAVMAGQMDALCRSLKSHLFPGVTAVCSVSAGLHGVSFLSVLNLMVILCLNIYPPLGLYWNKLVGKLTFSRARVLTLNGHHWGLMIISV